MKSLDIIITIPLILSAYGCVTQPPPTPEHGSLFFTGAKNANKILNPVTQTEIKNIYDDPSYKFLMEKDRENRIDVSCGYKATKEPQLAIGAPIIAWGVGQIVSWTIGELSDQLEKEASKYSVSTSIESHSINFYETLDTNGKRPATACFRVTRIGSTDKNNPKSPQTITMDFIGKIAYSPNKPELIEIEPLRLFYHRAIVKTAGRSIAINIKLSSDVIYRDELKSTLVRSAIDTSIISEAFFVDEKGIVKGAKIDSADQTRSVLIAPPFLYVKYNKQDDESATSIKKILPLPPWNYKYPPQKNQLSGNRMNSRAIITEVGNIPWLLNNASALLSKNKDGVVGDLTDSAKKLILK